MGRWWWVGLLVKTCLYRLRLLTILMLCTIDKLSCVTGIWCTGSQILWAFASNINPQNLSLPQRLVSFIRHLSRAGSAPRTLGNHRSSIRWVVSYVKGAGATGIALGVHYYHNVELYSALALTTGQAVGFHPRAFSLLTSHLLSRRYDGRRDRCWEMDEQSGQPPNLGETRSSIELHINFY